MVLRTFEFDDYPMSARQLLRVLDGLKDRYPNFKASVFAIPGAMTEKFWRPLEARQEWVEVCPHGIVHQKRECRSPEVYTLRLRWLDEIARERRYSRLFKAPWHGMDHRFMNLLLERDLEFCVGYVDFRIPFPTPEWPVWALKDVRMMNGGVGLNVEAHAIIPHRHRWHNRRYQQIDWKNVERFTADWSPDDDWQFVSQRTKPLVKRLYLGSGPLVLTGFDCLDPRDHLDPRIIKWEAPAPLPYLDNRVDVIVTSHMFNYLDDSWYLPLCQEMFRVVRPGGHVRLQEDATNSGYVWRKPGQDSRNTGIIRSLPTKRKILRALRRAGFKCKLARPGRTQSPHKSVLLADNRFSRWEKGHKFVLEGYKPAELEPQPRQGPPRRRHLRS